MASRKRAKINLPMAVACVLLCLTLFSIHLTSGLYARYVSKGEGSDDSRVAQFNVTENIGSLSTELLFELEPGPHEYVISVINGSEVAVGYTIAVSNRTKNIPLQFEVRTKESANGETTLDSFEKEFVMASNSVKHFVLRIYWDPENADEFMGMVDLIDITLKAVQKD